MFAFDVVMPLALFAITIVAVFLNKRVESKLKTSFEEREFRARDAVLFVIMITVAVSVIVFLPQFAIVTLFVSSYSALLFTFSYFFSNLKRRMAQLFAFLFGVAGILGGALAFLALPSTIPVYYGSLGLFGLAVSALLVVLYEQKTTKNSARWYLALLPPILFVLLFLVYSPTSYWFPVLMNTYGVVFAILITLYLSSLFTWKVTYIFAALLTMMDIILVLFTGVMVTAATHVAGLGLPVLISLPTIPLVVTADGIRYLSLGLGDFFFAGTLATQTLKKFGKKTAIASAIAMTISFGVFEVFLLSTDFGAFPGTVMIICGWIPIITWKLIAERKTKSNGTKENKLEKGVSVLTEQGA